MPDEDEDLFVPAEDEQDAPEPDAPEPAEPEDDTIEISFGDEPAVAAQPETPLVKRLRLRVEEQNRELAALRPAPKPVEVGPKPKIDDFYTSHPDDPEAAYDAALLGWNDARAKADAEAAARKKAAEDSNAAWQRELAGYAEKKAALRAPDYDAAEAIVVDALPQGYPQAIVKAAKDPAKVVYALAKHPDKLKSLAGLDGLQFVAEIARMEGQITVNTTRRPPPPEGTVRGSAPLSRSSDKVLEKMEADAAKDPKYDRGQIVRYKAQKAAARAPAGRR